MNEIPVEFLRSPLSKEELSAEDESTLVDAAGNKFTKDEQYGFWNFLPERSPLYSDQEWSSFQQLIDNFVISYNQNPTQNVSYDDRPEVLKFGEFCKFYGDVLDIGCGPHPIPAYIKFRKNEDAVYYGIDVLVGEQPKDMHFIQAMGEHLPLADESFDVSISGTSILHYINPQAGIEEALRVTKSSGYLCIWLGVKSEDAPVPAESPEWYKNLDTPDGAENPFHYKRYSTEVFEAFISGANGVIDEKEVHEYDEWRQNVFYRIKKA